MSLPRSSTIIGPRCPGPVSVVTNRRPGLGLARVRMLSVGTWNDGSVTKVATPAARSRAAESCGKASPSVVPAAAARNSRRVRFTRSDPTCQPAASTRLPASRERALEPAAAHECHESEAERYEDSAAEEQE